MATIVLSSSPVRTFARSPTPAELSPSPQSDRQDDVFSPKTSFRTASTARDSFSTSFATARQVLGVKSGAENVPVVGSATRKFKLSQPKRCDARVESPRKDPVDSVWCRPVDNSIFDFPDCFEDPPANNVTKIDASDLRKGKKKPKSKATTKEDQPLQLPKATTRRKDWTPIKSTPQAPSRGFQSNLAEAFAYNTSSSIVKKVKNCNDGALTKRRKIESLEIPTTTTKVLLKPPAETVTKKKRARSPPKKALTITALATSHYFAGKDAEKAKETPMMAFLTSTQARCEDDADLDHVQTKVGRKATKSKVKKKNAPPPRLKSPSTAMKTFEAQDVIFATASQLAREESPTFLRDTIEATKQSELDAHTDNEVPTSSQFGPISIPSSTLNTPNKNSDFSAAPLTTRFRGRRSLWSRADRDEDNALLHFDGVFDTPALLRDAFAGKDALVEQSARKVTPTHPSREALANKTTAELTTYDIDDVITPPALAKPFQTRISTSALPAFDGAPSPPSAQHVRAYSTTSRRDSPTRNSKRANLPAEASSAQTFPNDPPPPAGPPPSMPNYNTWTDDALKAKVKSYGFKRIRKRERLISILVECWHSQHGAEPEPHRTGQPLETEQPVQARHGDFLAQVHDITARPIPKIPKPKKSTTRKPRLPSNTTAPKRKQTKPAEQPVRETEAEAAVDSLSDIEADCTELPASTAPVKGTGVKASTTPTLKPTKSSRKAPQQSQPSISPQRARSRSRTPPASSPGFEPLASPAKPSTKPAPSALSTHILAALAAQPLPVRKPITPSSRWDPAPHPTSLLHLNADLTWKDKIQMFVPLVLEDFARWLNTEGLGLVGVDEELGVLEVRAWCEANGVCWCWRGGWRGNGNGNGKGKKKGKNGGKGADDGVVDGDE